MTKFLSHLLSILIMPCFGLSLWAAEGKLKALSWPQVVQIGEEKVIQWDPVLSQTCSFYVISINDAVETLSDSTTSFSWTPTNLEEQTIVLESHLADGTVITDQQTISVIDHTQTTLGAGWLVEIYKGIKGDKIANLISSSQFPDQPQERFVLQEYKTLKNVMDFYGVRARARFIAPIAGAYRFYVSGDDENHLSIRREDSGRKVIATTPGWTPFAKFNKYASQESVLIELEANEEIELEVLLKEHGGGDNFSVASNYNPETQRLDEGIHQVQPHTLRAQAYASLPYIHFDESLSNAVFLEGETLKFELTHPIEDELDHYRLVMDGLVYAIGLEDGHFIGPTLTAGKKEVTLEILSNQGVAIELDRRTLFVVGEGFEELPSGLLKESWFSNSINDVNYFQRLAGFPLDPDFRQWIPELQSSNEGIRRGVRYRGWLWVDQSGEHTFTLKSWGDSELWIGSADATQGMTKVASVPTRVRFEDDIRYREQVGKVELAMGWHAVEVLQETSNAKGKDYVTVSMRGADGILHSPIPQEKLKPEYPNDRGVRLTSPREGYTYHQGRTLTVKWEVEGVGYDSYEIYDGDQLMGISNAESKYCSIVIVETGRRNIRLVGLDTQGERHRVQRVEINVRALDRDHDDLSDYQESLAGTDITNHDSDFDGLDDGTEVYWTKTNPLVKDVNLKDHGIISPDSVGILSGNWIISSDHLFTREPTGVVTLDLSVEKNTATILELDVTRLVSANVRVRDGTIQNFKVWLSEKMILKKEFSLPSSGETTTLRLFLPHLPEGQLELELEWNSYIRGLGVVIEQARWSTIQSEGVLASIRLEESLTEPPVTSRVSPVDLHGLAPWLDRISVNGSEVQRGAGDSWFADVSLNVNSSTNVTVAMGETTTERQIDWEPTVIDNVDGQTMTLRAGDRLNIQAVQHLDSVSSVTLLKNGSTVSAGSMLFAEAGQNIIRAEVIQMDGQVNIYELNVHVLAKVDTDPVYIVHVPQKENQIDRLWSWVGLPEGVIVESNGLGVMEVEPVNGQRTFLLDQSAPQEGMLVARLPDTGAILGVAPIVPLEFTVSTSILGYMRLLEKLDDSTLVLEESYFCKNFPEELHLEVYFWTSGAFFDDGSSRKNFHKDSFQNNHFTVHMMKFLNLERQNYHFQTSACHRTSVYLGDQELYRF